LGIKTCSRPGIGLKVKARMAERVGTLVVVGTQMMAKPWASVQRP
jgi:hypothetical protein